MQLTSSHKCVTDLLKVDLIAKVQQLITVQTTAHVVATSSTGSSTVNATTTTTATTPSNTTSNPTNTSRGRTTIINTASANTASSPRSATTTSNTSSNTSEGVQQGGVQGGAQGSVIATEVVSVQVRRDLSLVLLAVMAYAAAELTRTDQRLSLHILYALCQLKDSDDDIVENCAHVLKFLSAYYTDFEEIDQVVRCLLGRGGSSATTMGTTTSFHTSNAPEPLHSGVANVEVADCLSTVLYNLTCAPRSVECMLRDAFYVNVMIRILRSGTSSGTPAVLLCLCLCLCAYKYLMCCVSWIVCKRWV